MKNRHNKNIGDYGEELATKFLQKRGYTILDRNFSSRYGEIDIIAFDPKERDTINCVEVKTRFTTTFGQPEDAITRTKIKKLHDTSCSYFFENNIEEKIFQLDVISILINKKTKKARIKYLPSIGFEDV